MITLSEAFKLCHIKAEKMVYLRENGKDDWHDYLISAKTIRNKLDMKKIRVVGIEPKFQRYGNDYLGLCFVVTGISEKEIQKLQYSVFHT